MSHDLSLAKHICHQVAVMYLGKIVGLALADELYRSPRHPYSLALLSAMPVPGAEAQRSTHCADR
jgi:ABC-type oligopeptide transport system ATPase subunit